MAVAVLEGGEIVISGVEVGEMGEEVAGDNVGDCASVSVFV